MLRTFTFILRFNGKLQDLKQEIYGERGVSIGGLVQHYHMGLWKEFSDHISKNSFKGRARVSVGNKVHDKTMRQEEENRQIKGC